MSDKNPHGGNGKQDWCTPHWFIAAVCERFGAAIGLDACAADASVAVCPNHITPKEDGLKATWCPPDGTHVWCNPPWANPGRWIAKALHEVRHGPCCPVVWMPLPASLETAWFLQHQHVAAKWLVTPRLNYYDPVEQKLTDGISKPTILWRIDAESANGGPSDTVDLNVWRIKRPPGATR